MGKRNVHLLPFLPKSFDCDTCCAGEEELAYQLVDFLLAEQRRLHRLILEAREDVNFLCLPGRVPYPVIAEDVVNAQFDDHPAMRRYFELYGSHAIRDE